ncbi:uncharacterized protein BJ171DRAFT_499918 [Polychytrium aggregatum]|uniref:uncharacterized protein n=1 Tax=Polychytrium aggregatum TaxID=110093 RepID=UPI0022FF4091|nr:uncharacterized protein BJ171DRAFT_499918 [Polychytrium aggregatum]KAI9205858.1 hypothetical protein BJ171DRAFT_499918 [Polychytrium aggregatum]
MMTQTNSIQPHGQHNPHSQRNQHSTHTRPAHRQDQEPRQELCCKLASDLAVLVDNSSAFADVHFIVENGTKTVYAHACILAARSPYFASCFTQYLGGGADEKTGSSPVLNRLRPIQVELPNLTQRHVQAYMYYLYTGSYQTDLPPKEILPFLQVIDEFQDDDLSAVFADLKADHLLLSDCLETLDLAASKFETSEVYQTLTSRCIDFVLSPKNGDLAWRFIEFDLGEEAILYLFDSDDLEFDELVIWDLMLKRAWIMAKGAERPLSQLKSFASLAELPPLSIGLPKSIRIHDLERLSTEEQGLFTSFLYRLFPTFRFPLLSSDQITDHILMYRRFLDPSLVEHLTDYLHDPTIIAETDPRLSPRAQYVSPKSEIISRTVEKKLLESYLPAHNLVLLYRASRDGFEAARFHQLCDNKGPTLCVVKSTTGEIGGGYTEIGWKSNNPSQLGQASETAEKMDPNAFLFSVRETKPPNLDRSFSSTSSTTLNEEAEHTHSSVSPGLTAEIRRYPVQGIFSNHSVVHDAGFGPCFGDDLIISDNCGSNSRSECIDDAYEKHGPIMGTRYPGGHFRVADYEVFQVTKA